MPDNLPSFTARRARTGTLRRPLIRPALAGLAVASLAVTGLATGAIVTAGAATAASASSTTSARVLHSVPRYYLALSNISTHSGDLDAVIHSTRTGQVLATIRPPKPFRSFGAVTGAADDRTFILAAQPRPPSAGNPTAFFRARFDPATGQVRLTRLAIPGLPAAALLTGFAITPNGARLAIAALTGSNAKIMVYSLATGTVRTWQSPGTIGSSADDYLGISWGRAGTLAVNWEGLTPADGVRLLDTAGPDGSLLQDSRLAVADRQPGGYAFNWDGVITPNGRAIICPMWRPRLHAKPGTAPIEMEFQVFSAATGRKIRSEWRIRTSSETAGWTNSSGRIQLVNVPSKSATSPQAKLTIGLLSGGHFTPLPGAPVVDGSYPLPVF